MQTRRIRFLLVIPTGQCQVDNYDEDDDDDDNNNNNNNNNRVDVLRPCL
jgi:hypothetical protein